MKTIIVGAGASGLMAGYELSRRGVEVLVVEAENRIGGRVHTFIPEGFVNFIEAGAEFIHGDLPLTKSLMSKAKLEYVPASLEMFSFYDGTFSHGFDSPFWATFVSEAEKLKRDCTLSEFLERHFLGDEYKAFRSECHAMAQGLDLADPDRLSMFCIRTEWTQHDTQYRPVAGYSPLLGFLADSIATHQGQILLGRRVDAIKWSEGSAEVFADPDVFKADAVIVTTTLGNLQHRNIAFEPPIDNALFDKIGFGEVLKIAMEFEFPFWETTHPDLGFLFTDEEFTFWTQLSLRRPILIGWIGNDRAAALARLSDEVLTARLLSKLSEVFPQSDVAKILRAFQVFRYTKDAPTNGGYSWTTPESRKAIAQINKGVSGTIWFAGEAFERTADVGTVEAALQSGRYIARKLLKSKQ